MCMHPKANGSAGGGKKRKGLSHLVKKDKQYGEPPYSSFIIDSTFIKISSLVLSIPHFILKYLY